MTDQAETPTPRSGGRLDPLQILFWVSVMLGVAAAGVAITAGPTVGRAGAILLVLIAASGMVLFVWMSRGAGRRFGAFPERGAIAAATFASGKAEFAALDALDEAALITDRALSPLIANHAYLTLADEAGMLGGGDRPPALSRLFGADPLLSAPMFRLAKAAGQGLSRREELPPTSILGGKPVRYEASVGAMSGGYVLWRLREISLGAGAEGDAEARTLFVDDAPVGFFAARVDGSIIYMNRALRAVLGVGDDPALLRVKDVIKEDSARVLRKDRRGFGPTRTRVTLRARDGVESQASVLSFWPAEEADGAARVLVFFSEAETPETQPQPLRVDTAAADGVFAQAPFGAAVLDCTDPASAALLDSNGALMEMTQGRATPGAAFADLFTAAEAPPRWRRICARLSTSRWS
ncbi:MAG TPA: PAS domain-containing protein [Terricaulis sp.]|nr:PAS domain-containing protein [Terricaulis sp.]